MNTAMIHEPVGNAALPHLAAPTQVRLRELLTPAMPMQSLRRTGLRPYAFNGSALVTICGVGPTLPFWYELNVFRTVVDSYVCDVRLFHKSEAADMFRVAEHDDLDDAIAWFENYAPAADVLPDPSLLAAPSAAELAIATARLQVEVEATVAHYRSLVGQLLVALTVDR